MSTNDERKREDRTGVRTDNRDKAVGFARRRGVFSRVELAEATGLSPATVTRLVRELIADGYLAEAGPAPSRGGRPQTMLAFRPEAELVAVIDVQDGVLEGSLRDWSGAWHGNVDRRALTDIAGDVVELVEALRAASGDRVKAVALAVPGVAADGGDIRLAPSLAPRAAGPTALWEERLRLPVLVDNDVNLMVVGEHVGGAAADTDDVLLVHVGDRGIGAALMIGGRVRHGARGFAGEIGFLPFGQPRPAADELGAFEAEWALAPLAERAGTATDGDVTAAVRTQRPELLQDALRAWGRAVAAAVCVVDPAAVLVSGPALTAAETAVLVDEVARFVPGEADIRLASIGHSALALGAARCAFDLYDARSRA